MPAQPCANHPKEITYVRCGRCDKPICTRCMVDSPVGKKCRDCAVNRTHLSESSALEVAYGLSAGLVAATAAAWTWAQVQFFILAFAYGWLVGEVVLRAGKRRRSLAMQAAGGIAALAGGILGKAMAVPRMPLDLPEAPGLPWGLHWELATDPYWLVLIGIGTVFAVSRIRFL